MPTRTRVIFLQHPRERRVAIGTARMAHLALPNSEFHSGVIFEEHSRLGRALCDPSADAAVLYPADEADSAPLGHPPKTLVVVDGTWSQARKVLARNPILNALPRWALRPSQPGNYRIRREPAAHCLSTIEAVVEALGQIEGPPERFTRMLHAFTRMVDRQIECQAARVGPSRHQRRRRVRAPRFWSAPELKAALDRLVLVHAEANAPAVHAEARFDPELVQLVAVRPSTGERFEMFVAPRQVLADSTPKQLDVSAERLRAGEALGVAVERWNGFLAPDDVLAAWGTFTPQLLQQMGTGTLAMLNFRALAARALNHSPGGVQTAAAELSSAARIPSAMGRAGRRLAALEQVLDGLLQTRLQAPRASTAVHDGRG